MKARKVKGLDPRGALGDNAKRTVLVRLGELYSFAGAAADPDEVEALHDMRIAAKRLRYILELTEPALGEPARLGAREARNLQGLLGDIHDCDVMLPLAKRHLRRLRRADVAAVREAHHARARTKDLEPAALRDAPHRNRYRGVESLIVYLQARREVLYDRFRAEWGRLERTGFRESMERGLAHPPPPRGKDDHT